MREPYENNNALRECFENAYDQSLTLYQQTVQEYSSALALLTLTLSTHSQSCGTALRWQWQPNFCKLKIGFFVLNVQEENKGLLRQFWPHVMDDIR